MFEPDEFLYTKIVKFLSRRKRTASERLKYRVNLADIKPRLTLLACAITGKSIEIYPAEREGGYRNSNFFLPFYFDGFTDYDKNIAFYLFRVLYLAEQKNLGQNWTDGKVEHATEESQLKALEGATAVLETLFDQYPVCQQIHAAIQALIIEKTPKNKEADYSILYGKWMRSDVDGSKDTLHNFDDKTKTANPDAPKTVLKANAVEEIISVQVDTKKQEDFSVNHSFEKVETVDEHNGGWRDFDGDDELDDHQEALQDLNMKYTVRVDDTAHSVYQAEFVENTTVSESAQSDTKGYHITYDEWDYSKRAYKPGFCKVYPKKIMKSDASYYQKTLSDNRSTLMGLRKMMTSVNNKYQQVRRQTQGEEFDLDALTDLFVEVRSGHTPSENIYFSKRKKEKDLSILLLLDVSLSSDGYAAGNRVIDVEKQVSILFGEILEEFNIDFAINAFYSKTRNHSSYVTLKGFDDDWNKAKHKVGAIEPNGYTRIGAALRHAGAELDLRETKNKWVILISDGKPNDYDRYEGKYGVNDVKQALRELNQRHINSYALAIEASAKYYLPQMFGQNHYQILTTPVELLQSLVLLYEKIKHQST
ncbi:MAG: VWA domain-containing protein [Flavobacteriaceae bacterium]|nr:VWA domain-containing protein [Flavobacteriaceae bacterium]